MVAHTAGKSIRDPVTVLDDASVPDGVLATAAFVPTTNETSLC